MTSSFVLPLEACTDLSLVGGKATGLARLLAQGFHVPCGICVTTDAYHEALRAVGLDAREIWCSAIRAPRVERHRILASCRIAIRESRSPEQLGAVIIQELSRLNQPSSQRWAVRSSATNEDAAVKSFAGLYHTELGVSLERVTCVIQDCWVSLWDEQVMEYHLRAGGREEGPAMAVVIQPVINALAAGVTYSIHPVTGKTDQVMINAVPGLAVALVSGAVIPDQYLLRFDQASDAVTILTRQVAIKGAVLRLGMDGVQDEPLLPDVRNRSSLADEELVALTRLAKRIERTFQHPVDVEWAIDDQGIWLLQARPVTVMASAQGLTQEGCEWSRTNFKETMPELPSPLGLSFLERFMESFLITPYRRLGCRIPSGVSSVQIVHGRPVLNVTLMYSVVGQLRGDTSILAEHMGGESLSRPPKVEPLGLWSMLRAGILISWSIRRAAKQGPRWFAEMKQMAADHSPNLVQGLSLTEVRERMDRLNRRLEENELTFGIAGGVTQCLQAFGFLLPRWLGEGWRGLLNGALQGQAHAISAEQIIRLAALADMARHDARCRALLTAEGWEPSSFRSVLRDTDFLRSFDRYIEDYGHRGMGESDIMSPRFADQPELVLEVLRTQLRTPGSGSPSEIVARQAAVRNDAVRKIKKRFGRRIHRWVIFSWWYRRLCRYFALREANRHHLMYYSLAARSLLLRAGTLFVERGLFHQAEDMFFIRLEEQEQLFSGAPRDWRALIRSRRAERVHNAEVAVPDTLRDGSVESMNERGADAWLGTDRVLRGIPISAGRATGSVRLVRSMADWSRVSAGDILVVAVIDPGMAPLFGIVAGLIAEMGGTLSHGAIIAREYGLPTVANVHGVTSRLKDGDRISLDAERGEIIIQERGGDSSATSASPANHDTSTQG